MRVQPRSAPPCDDDDQLKQQPAVAKESKEVKVRTQKSNSRPDERKALNNKAENKVAAEKSDEAKEDGAKEVKVRVRRSATEDKKPTIIVEREVKADNVCPPAENLPDKEEAKDEGAKPTQNSQEAPSKTGSTGELAVDKEEERMLRRVEGFHGYLPREDVNALLKNQGDYLLRISETGEDGKGGMLKEIILSVLGEQTKEGETKTMVRNMVVSKKEGKYFLNTKKKFGNLLDLLIQYKATPWTNSSAQQGKVSFRLVNPIPLQKWEFIHRDVIVGAKLGMGAFGEVCRGKLKTKKGFTIDVAIKVTKGDVDISKKKIKELVNEARLVRFFKHKNVVRTYGVALDKQPLFIILELVGGGSLNNYLRSHGKSTSDTDRLAMCMGAAKGLQYLHQHNTVHADVAARNCLVTSDKIVKISDFGLAFVLNPEEVSRRSTITKLPVKWLSPETIQTISFSLKSDVYSFGVLCFEIYNDGGEPYSGITNKEAKALIMKGECLELASNCPEMFKEFLKQRIFNIDPKQRPSMTEVVYALARSGAPDTDAPPKKL